MARCGDTTVPTATTRNMIAVLVTRQLERRVDLKNPAGRQESIANIPFVPEEARSCQKPVTQVSLALPATSCSRCYHMASGSIGPHDVLAWRLSYGFQIRVCELIVHHSNELQSTSSFAMMTALARAKFIFCAEYPLSPFADSQILDHRSIRNLARQLAHSFLMKPVMQSMSFERVCELIPCLAEEVERLRHTRVDNAKTLGSAIRIENVATPRSDSSRSSSGDAQGRSWQRRRSPSKASIFDVARITAT